MPGHGEHLGLSRRCHAVDAVNRLRGLIVAVVGGMVLIAVSTTDAYSQPGRHTSREVAREFQRKHPCPSTGRPSGACPGYVKDHIIPLACRGPDIVSNMQWQTVEAAKAKDAWELQNCGR